MKKITLIILLVLVAGFFLVNGIGNAIESRNAEKAAQSQLEALQAQQIMDSLPEWGRTLIVTIGVLYGMETFGPMLLLAAGGTVLALVVIGVMVIFQIIAAFSRNESAPKYAFYNSVIVSGLVIVIGGFMLASVPGGAALFRKLFTGALVFGFFAMGGGFGLRFSGGKFTSTTDQNGNMETTAVAPKVAVVISGRKRKASDSDVTVEWEE